MTIYLDRTQVEALIAKGDTYQGLYVLAVAPDGTDHKILWQNYSRTQNDYPEDWLVTKLPVAFPEGQKAKHAENTIHNILGRAAWKEANRRHQREEIGWIELAEELCPDDWTESVNDQIADLAQEWLYVLNDEPSYLNIKAPWGYSYSGKPACFEYVTRFKWEE